MVSRFFWRPPACPFQRPWVDGNQKKASRRGAYLLHAGSGQNCIYPIISSSVRTNPIFNPAAPTTRRTLVADAPSNVHPSHMSFIYIASIYEVVTRGMGHLWSCLRNLNFVGNFMFFENMGSLKTMSHAERFVACGKYDIWIFRKNTTKTDG